ncbi:MAG: Integral membrane protein TerC [Parcubacteria group bacterium GW2011_GWA1_47_8]|nr:MAG: Integral membrane protein TerC [Parcubacteria group bacterium GW2011_GWA1_47_8]KKW07130.1 MAG: Integral membrane protein TerC [Parcubacteria group bacterium GW2011_GWA2_49_16]
MFSIFLILLGLIIFEIVMSIDNAVVNADVLASMKTRRARRFFLTWGILFAVFVVRGFLPSVIVYLADPSIGLWGALEVIWQFDIAASQAVLAVTPIIMMAGGMFLVLLWEHWLFIEDKNFGLPHEQYIQKYGAVWFYSVAALLLVGVLIEINASVLENPMHLALAAAVGFSVFFITQGFKDNAEKIEERLIESGEHSAMSDWAKVVFLEVLDVAFSIDSVVGAFAFTTVVPFILIGSGLGAIVVRQLTVAGIDRIRSYSYLKNGAMYSVGFLGGVMLLEAFGVHIPFWIPPIVTIGFVGYFFWRSIAENKANGNLKGSVV